MRYVCVLTVLLAGIAASAQNGAEVYKTHCASYHNSAAPRVPSESALRAANWHDENRRR